MEGTIIFNNQSYTFNEFATTNLPNSLDWAANTQVFVKSWLNGQESFLLQTSGSTGKPKSIPIHKSQMLASAQATIQYLNIQPGAKALLCMNPEMIGGRMMLVRAIIGNWQLYVLPPSSSPIIDSNIDFAAMVPMQVESLMESVAGKTFLNGIDQLIIGGANISDSLLRNLQDLKTKVYQTFGMTETVSHIALRRVNGQNISYEYELIGDNEIKIDETGKMAVRGTVTNHEWVSTNDVIQPTKSGFKWLGRADLVVNSGGVKILIEPLEMALTEFFNSQIWVWKKQHNKLGEQLVGLTDNEDIIYKVKTEYNLLKVHFKEYHLPKEWVLVEDWQLTPSGKPNREKTLLTNSQLL